MEDEAHDLALGKFTRLSKQILRDAEDHRRRIIEFDRLLGKYSMAALGDGIDFDGDWVGTLTQLVDEGRNIAARIREANQVAKDCGQSPMRQYKLKLNAE